MKKLICLVLCLAFVSCLLVGCADDEIGADLDKLKDKVNIEEVEEIELDLYVIVGEGTTDNATKTVELMINQYLEKFKTSLDIHYLSASEYEATVMRDLTLSGDDKADIVLITSDVMFDSMMADNLIANVTTYFDPVSSKYKSLNTQICSALLSAVTIKETSQNSSGQVVVSNSKYCVPNNHIVSNYELFLMSIEASEYYCISENAFNLRSADKIMQMFEEKIAADPTYTLDQCVVSTVGSYADYQAYLNGGEYYVKATVPEVTREEAYSSAFAIARHEKDRRHESDWEGTKQEIAEYTKYYDRCMEIIYELNNSVELRNLLQYGKLNTNYKIDEQTGSVTHDSVAPDDVYVMDLCYTGDVFKAYYCDCELHSWTAEDADYGVQQNKDSVYFATVSISEAIALSNNSNVLVSGNVKEINTAWDDQYGYISVTIEDAAGKTLYVDNLATKVVVDDVITVKGKLGTVNGVKQITAGAIATVDDPAPVEVTIPEALQMDDNRRVIIQGTVKEINTEWSDELGNMSVTIEDADGNTIYVFALATKVVVGDVITVKGRMATDDSVRQIAAGATATVDDPAPVEVTIPEANRLNDNTRVIVKGTVKEINTEWSDERGDMSVIIEDADGNTLYVFGLKSEVAVGDAVTVSGRMETVNGVKQIGAGATAIVGADDSGDVTEPEQPDAENGGEDEESDS